METTINTASTSATAPVSRIHRQKWKRTERLKLSIVVLIFVTCVVAMMFVNLQAERNLDFYIGFFLSLTFAYFLFKMVLSFFYKPVLEEPAPGLKVSAIIPSYNENPESVKKTIMCLIEQDYPLHEIIFIDDGSKDTLAYQEVKQLASELEKSKQLVVGGESVDYIPKIIAHRFEKNRGKRVAQTWGFKRMTGDFILICDSDCYLYPNVVRELLKPFKDKKVLSVTGHVNVRNLKDSLMTRLQDVLYESAFRVGRGSQSVTNSVLVCSGAISMHRKKHVMENLHEFENQTLFGIPVQVGDDRRLTTIALKTGGKTKYQSTAKCITDAPTTVKKFFKQQVRWSKSFYIDSLKALTFAWKRPLTLMWILGEGLIWLVFGLSIIFTFLYKLEIIGPILFVYSIGYLILSALSKNVYYIFKNPLMYLASPFFALIHMTLLFPIRFYALATLINNSWGTR